MTDLKQRALSREQLVKIAKDSVVERASKLFLQQYQTDLEHLQPGQVVDPKVPVGKDKFLDWCKNVLEMFFPEVSGVTENEKISKEYAVQIADAISKSNTDVENPLRDYEKKQEPTFVKAQTKKAQSAEKSFTPSGSIKTDNLFTAPVEHSRYCPDHPGVMIRRVKDNTYQCPISQPLNQVEPWKDKYDYRGGHEVSFETGVQNQTSLGPNNLHPILPFLSTGKDTSRDFKGKKYDFDKLYGVSIDAPDRQDQKAAELLNKITKKSHCGTCGIKCDVCGEDPCACEKTEKKAQMLFGPTTMMTRQCPDHPGKQLLRVTDNVRQCLLDHKIYDFEKGFTTEDGKFHPGGSVINQQAIPPGSIIIKKDAAKKYKGFHSNIEKDTVKNKDFRKVLYTGSNSQLVLMSLKPKEDIGEETHNVDQFLRIDSGKGKAIIDGNEYNIKDGSALIIPAGAKHNVINTSKDQDLKLYSVYSPPHHKDQVIHKTKQEASESDEHFDGKLTEGGKVKVAQLESNIAREFLFDHVYKLLPANAEYARRVLDYMLKKAVSLEEAIIAIRQADELAAQQKMETAGIKNFIIAKKN